MRDLYVVSVLLLLHGVFGIFFLVGFQDYNSLELNNQRASEQKKEPADNVQEQDESNTLLTPDIDGESSLQPLPEDEQIE